MKKSLLFLVLPLVFVSITALFFIFSQSAAASHCGGYASESLCTGDSACLWDSSVAVCNNKCGLNEFWDTFENKCKAIGTTSCSSGYYLDSASRSCKFDCGYYTDQSSCILYSECSWDTFTNICGKKQSSITATSCSTGYIWDAALNICVRLSTGAKVEGVVSDSSGNPVKGAPVSVHDSNWSLSWWGNTDSNGKYIISDITPGTYLIEVSPPPGSASNLLSPSPANITLADRQTLIQNFSFLKSAKTINGSVKMQDGTPITDAAVYANQKDTGKSIHRDVDAMGSYSLSVGGGLWEVGVYPKSSSANWSYSEPPKSAIFANDSTTESATLDFKVTVTDAKITGKVLKSDGTSFPANTIYINLYSSSQGRGFDGQAESNGSFIFSVSAGVYEVKVFSKDNTFTAPYIAPVSISTGETKDLGTITLMRAAKTLKGKVAYLDGRAVADASVGAYKKDTQKWQDASVDSSGNYTIVLTGGSWEISIHPTSMSPNWSYNMSPKIISFADDKTQETKTLDFSVISADAKIVGKILKPDGSAPSRGTIFVDVWSSASSFGMGGQAMQDGSFSISVPEGTYNIDIHSQDPTLSAPSMSPITVGKAETKDLGTITLKIKGDHIKGKVSDRNGNGLSNIRIDARTREGQGYSSAITDSNGDYDLLVTPGKWEVNAMPKDPSISFYNPDPPKSVEVLSGIVSIVKFTLLVADAGISGNVVDSSGNILSDLYGFVNLSKLSSGEFSDGFGFGPGIGGPIERGKFSFKAPAGAYNLQVFLPPESPYTPKDTQSVALISGETTNVNVTVSKNNSRVEGTIKDKNGDIITGADVFVFATSKNGVWQEAAVDRATGKYTLKLSAGTWYLGYHVDPNSGYLPGETSRIEVSVLEGATVTKDLVIQKADSKVTGQVTDPDGRGIPYVFVDVSKISFKGFGFESAQKTGEIPFVAGAETDANGFYTVSVPADSYFINVFVPPHINFVSPEEKPFTIAEAETKTLNLKLRSANLKISGKVFAGGVAVKDGFVWAWSESGGYRETNTQSDGFYELFVPSSSVWHLGAGASLNNEFYKSNEVVVTVSDESVFQEIILKSVAKLAESASKSVDVTKQTVVESSEGVSIFVPASSLSTSGSVTISVTPDTRVASQGGTKKVVGVAYELEARSDDGTLVSDFNSDVTVSLPYKDEDLASLGVTEDGLYLAFWDETVATWKNVDNYVINKAEKIVTGTVDHFTRFAIVSAADVTPPQPPLNVSALAFGDGKIKLTWENPASDFSHSKIYRSTTSGAIGTLRVSEASGVEYTDTGLTDGTTYYYTVRAVDPAGNESSNTNQVSAVASGSSAEIPSGDSGVKEGDLIRGPDGIKVYIINAFGFRRHIFNPAVFGMYQHFSWDSIKDVSQSTLDSYTVSDLYRSLIDPRVYSLEEIDETSGIAIKHHLEMTPEQFTAEGYDWSQVFIVNDEERDYYETGVAITSTK